MTNESWSAKWRILYEKWHPELTILVWHMKVDLKVKKRVWQMTPWVDDFKTVWLLTPHRLLDRLREFVSILPLSNFSTLQILIFLLVCTLQTVKSRKSPQKTRKIYNATVYILSKLQNRPFGAQFRSIWKFTGQLLFWFTIIQKLSNFLKKVQSKQHLKHVDINI